MIDVKIRTSVGISRAASHRFSQVVPVWEDGVVVGGRGGPRQRTDIGKGGVRGRKLRIAVRRHIDGVKRLVIQDVRERAARRWLPHHPRDCRCLSCLARCWRLSDAIVVMVWRRATFDRVVPREGRVRIALSSSDRPGANARRHAASEIEMHREPGSHVAVDDAGQRSRCRQHCRSGSDHLSGLTLDQQPG